MRRRTAKSRFSRTSALVALNANIHQFRTLLVNPEVAPLKADEELRSGGSDGEEKLRSFFAEVMAIIKLSRIGYKKFLVLRAAKLSVVDYEAEDPTGKRTKIEVKNLQEPEDIIRTVVLDQWKKRSSANLEKYRFKAVLRHSHKGTLSSAAINRLRSIIDVLPKARKPFDEVLDGGVHIRLEKVEQARLENGEDKFLEISGRNKPGIMIVSGITSEHLITDISEVQSLFVKALPRVVGSLPKFFGETFTAKSDCRNLIALRWEPPDLFVSDEMMEFVQMKIEGLFAEFQLPLTVIIFVEPEVDWGLIKKYS